MMLNIKNFNFERCNLILTPNIESILLSSMVLKRSQNKKEVKNDLLSKLAPLIIQGCSSAKIFCELNHTTINTSNFNELQNICSNLGCYKLFTFEKSKVLSS